MRGEIDIESLAVALRGGVLGSSIAPRFEGSEIRNYVHHLHGLEISSRWVDFEYLLGLR
jgi:hypothetical protein